MCKRNLCCPLIYEIYWYIESSEYIMFHIHLMSKMTFRVGLDLCVCVVSVVFVDVEVEDMPPSYPLIFTLICTF
jgi:hypothetical protein